MFAKVLSWFMPFLGWFELAEDLSEGQRAARGICPACGARDLHAGPEGGASVNFACFTCKARFNGCFGWSPEDVIFLERTGDIDERTRSYFREERIGDEIAVRS